MTANELAVLLDNTEFPLCREAATMLCQQQSKEESLCSMVKEYQDKVDELRTEIEAIEQSKDRLIKILTSMQTEKRLLTHPVKKLHLSLQKTEDGELVAVTYTDDEHRIVEVLWERPPVKELTEDDILKVIKRHPFTDGYLNKNLIDFAMAILREASEK